MKLASFSRLIDSAVGVADFNHPQKIELAIEQIRFTARMATTLAISGALVAALLLHTAWATGQFQMFLPWTIAVVLVNSGILIQSRMRKSDKKRAQPAVKMRRMIFQTALMGVIWAFPPLVIFPVATTDLKLVIALATGGLLVAATVSFAMQPKAALAFMIPVSLGAIFGLLRADDPAFGAPVFLLLIICIGVSARMLMAFGQFVAIQIKSRIAVREQGNFFSLLLKEFEENANDWLWEFDAKGFVHRVSQRFESASGLPQEKLANQAFLDVLANIHAETSVIEKIGKLIELREAFRDLEFSIEIDGTKRWWNLTGKPNFTNEGEYQGYIGIGSEITSEKTAEIEISLLAHSDSLTGLMNRARFNEDMEQASASLERYGTPFAVLFLDLDKFKLINDTRGHLVGDKLLKMVGTRIQRVVRETDRVARLGGDEFAIIMLDKCDAGAAAKLAARLIQEISRSYEIDEERHKIGVSIGIALAPINGTRPNQLLRNADLALYRSKADGRGVFRFFEAQMDADQREKRMLELELKSAIENDEFELYYQPLMSTNTGKPTGMEALIRWHHPIRGMISPLEFIPIAEKSTLIQEIGNWSVRQACLAALDWPQDVVVAVNLSAHHFIGSEIVENTRKTLEETGLPPHRLELEITESLLINNTEEALTTLKQLKGLGVTIALDDFGTGYSSLSYVLKFPFDKIKIDRSFVTALSEDESAKAILRMISTLGESLNIRITAEGVETLEQVEFLRSIRCHQFQGYFFARPLKGIDLPSFFLRHTDVRAPEELLPTVARLAG